MWGCGPVENSDDGNDKDWTSDDDNNDYDDKNNMLEAPL